MINLEALFSISYGMYIVSSGDKNAGNGFISNSVFQVTAEPPKFAVCCNKDNYTAEIILSKKIFSISVLNQNASSKLIGKFGYKSGKTVNKFEGSTIKYGETGVPIILDESIAFIECNLVDTIDVGTHFLFIGEVVQAENITAGEPLTYAYYREVKKGLSPKNAPTYIDKSKLQKKESPVNTKKYKCLVCGYVYDPEKGDPDSGIKPGTPFEDIPSGWFCPVCGASKDDFVEL